MDLPGLVELRERLKKSHDAEPIQQRISELVSRLSADAGISGEYVVDVQNLIGQYLDMLTKIGEAEIILNDIEAKINEEITHKSKKFFTDNYDVELSYQNPENILTVRVMYIPSQVRTTIESRLGNYIKWQFPALEIGCKDGPWTRLLVGADPLYVMDEHWLFIERTTQKFPEEYQRRIRPYLLKDANFDALPDGQLGFVFSWNFFNYLSLDTTKRLLKNLYSKLRPGATIMFSYNNGDMPAGAAYADSYFMSYLPKSMLVPMCQSLGYEVTASFDFEPAVSWLEITKPGVLTTTKAHQALGVIKRINH